MGREKKNQGSKRVFPHRFKDQKEIEAIHLSRRGHLIFNYTEYSIIPA